MGGDGNAGSSSIILPWNTTPFPTGANQANVAVTYGAGFVWAGGGTDPIFFDDAYGKYRWTSTQAGGVVNVGAQIAWGVPVPKDDTINYATLYALIKVNNTARFKNIYLLINDSSNNQSSDVLGALSNDTWAEISYTTPNSINAWDDLLRFSLTIRGTDNSANVGITEAYVQYLRVKFTT